jgi:hypothetical protein
MTYKGQKAIDKIKARLMKHKKTPITSCIMDTKHQDTKKKGQNIH